MPIPLGSAFSREALEARFRDEPDWLKTRRRLAWERFESSPWPSRADEEWRRTDLARLDYRGIARLGGGQTTMDGAALFGHAPESCEQAGPRPSRETKFTALNEAFAEAEALVHVAPGATRLASIVRRGGEAFFPRTLVVLEERSEAVVVEVEEDDSCRSGLCSGLAELRVGPGAKLTYVRVQVLGEGVGNFDTIQATLKAGSDVTLVVANAGGQLTKQFVEASLVGEGARLGLFGLTAGARSQHHDIQATIVHAAPSTTSDVLYRTALRGRARSVFVGTIQVKKGASKTDAYEASRNLLLSKEARADSIPRLEIETDDVRCGHASATGPLDEEQLFYLMSRGLTAGEAENLIVEGFFADALTRAPGGGELGWVPDFVRGSLMRVLEGRDRHG
ncbi:MAG: Fe-S cluster assembly protein SufD [Candidatus Riflebacteria bacterium]|nr:Fe-S cluster assembly protein SufD [Candidatus Riflebacteria bacterium]